MGAVPAKWGQTCAVSGGYKVDDSIHHTRSQYAQCAAPYASSIRAMRGTIRELSAQCAAPYAIPERR
eukprot:333091-Rhodomonas_salina.1